jgi:hypothetical protein
MSKLGTSNEGQRELLYLCRNIIEKNQGQLTAVSEKQNSGSILPLFSN